MTKEIKKTKEVKVAKKPVKHTALKRLCTINDGIVNAGDECTLTSKELTLLKKAKAV